MEKMSKVLQENTDQMHAMQAQSAKVAAQLDKLASKAATKVSLAVASRPEFHGRKEAVFAAAAAAQCPVFGVGERICPKK